MKALLFTRPGIGGAATVVEQLVRLLPGEGVDVTVLCSPLEDAAYPLRLASYGVPVRMVRLERGPAPASDLAAYLSLARLLREQRFDVLHLHTTKPGLLGRYATSRVAPSTRVVYSPHGFYFDYAPSAAARDLYLALERALGAETDLLIACSEQEGRRALDEGIVPQERLAVVPNGVYPRPVTGEEFLAIMDRLGLDSGDVAVTMAARMAPPKDPVTLVRAAARIAPRHPRARFLFIGDGPLRKDAEGEAARLGVAACVRFIGPISPLGPVFARSAVSVLSSASEGLPMVVLESLLHRAPVVASDIPGCREVIEDGVNGLLFPHGSDERLAQALDRLLSDEELRTGMGREGMLRVMERHDARTAARQVAEAYRRVLQ